MADTVDIVVVGGGPGGYTAAIRAAQRGARVVLFEKDRLGGVCLNRGCIPSKALIETGRVFAAAAHGAAVGVTLPGAPAVDWARAQTRKQAVVDRMMQGVEFLLKKNKVRVVKGQARVEAGFRVAAGAEAVQAGAVILATGSEPAVIPGLEPDGQSVLDSDGILALETVPASLAVIGGGAIGCEWASLFASLGVKVEVVELLDQLVPGADADAAKELLRGFKKRQIRVHTGTKVESLARGPEGVRLTLSSGKEVTAEKALVSVGRRPALGDAVDPALGLATDRGRVPVDGATATNLKGIHAIGDVTGEILLAHFASHQGLVAAENLTGGSRAVDRGAVPFCVFTEPEVAWVGLTEEAAEKEGIAVCAGTFPFRALGRAHAAEEIWGFVKVVARKDSGTVMGFHAVGPRATDLVAEGTLAVRWGLTLEQLEETIHAHPTFPEAVGEAAADALGMAIHK